MGILSFTRTIVAGHANSPTVSSYAGWCSNRVCLAFLEPGRSYSSLLTVSSNLITDTAGRLQSRTSDMSKLQVPDGLETFQPEIFAGKVLFCTGGMSYFAGSGAGSSF